jgi:hypothetical protein
MAEVDSMQQDGSIAAMRQALREAIVAQGGQAAEGIKTWEAKVDVFSQHIQYHQYPMCLVCLVLLRISKHLNGHLKQWMAQIPL